MWLSKCIKEVNLKSYFLILLAVPILAMAANVFIWNFDPLDKFYDGQLGDSIDAAYWLEQTLASNGHTYNTATTLPTVIDGYDVVFITLGWFRC